MFAGTWRGRNGHPSELGRWVELDEGDEEFQIELSIDASC